MDFSEKKSIFGSDTKYTLSSKNIQLKSDFIVKIWNCVIKSEQIVSKVQLEKIALLQERQWNKLKTHWILKKEHFFQMDDSLVIFWFLYTVTRSRSMYKNSIYSIFEENSEINYKYTRLFVWFIIFRLIHSILKVIPSDFRNCLTGCAVYISSLKMIHIDMINSNMSIWVTVFYLS